MTLENTPLVLGAIVAFLSFLSSFLKFLSESDTNTRGLKKIKAYTEIYSALPDKVAARDDIALLLRRETRKVIQRSTRKINAANIAAVIFVAVVGGTISYLLALWATNSTITFFAVIAWLLFAITALLTIGISIAGLASMYEEPAQKSKK